MTNIIDINQAVLTLYDTYKSQRTVSKILKISVQKVRKILISNGVFMSERCRKILELRESGETPKQIAEELNIKVNTVLAYYPYTKVIYYDDILQNK